MLCRTSFQLQYIPEPIDVDLTQIYQPQTLLIEDELLANEEDIDNKWLEESLGKKWVLDEPVKYNGPTTESQSHLNHIRTIGMMVI